MKTVFTLLINTEFYNLDELAENSSASEVVKDNVNAVWELASKVAHNFEALGWRIEESYLGLLNEQYEKLYAFEFKDPTGTTTSTKGNKFIENFIQDFGSQFNFVLNELEAISVSLICDGSKSRPSDEEMLVFSHNADLDCEAIVYFDENDDLLVMQGYERGEYETGYFNCGQTDDHTENNEFNKYFFALQDIKHIKERIQA